MAGIDVSIGEVRYAASKLKDYASDIADLKAQLNDLGQNVQGGWGSESTAGYLELLGTTEKKLGILSYDVSGISGSLSRLATDLERTEKEIASIFGG